MFPRRNEAFEVENRALLRWNEVFPVRNEPFPVRNEVFAVENDALPVGNEGLEPKNALFRGSKGPFECQNGVCDSLTVR